MGLVLHIAAGDCPGTALGPLGAVLGATLETVLGTALETNSPFQPDRDPMYLGELVHIGLVGAGPVDVVLRILKYLHKCT